MASEQDGWVQIRGFQVQITEGTGGTGKGEDENWQKVTGGADQIEVLETTVGNEQFKTFAPGHTGVTPLTLEGFMTATRLNMLKWIKATADGEAPRRNLTVIPIMADNSQGKQHVYNDCLIEEYTYPELQAHSHDPLVEKVTVRPEQHLIQ
ncbi:MAG: phage tail protein [Polyangiaceae bacterium]